MDLHYDSIKSKTKYYIISDIHGDLILFVKFLIGVYNNLSGNNYYVSNNDVKFQYFKLSDELINDIKVKNAITYEYDNVFKIYNANINIPYLTFISELNELLKSNNSCIVLNGDIFNNHYQLADKTQPPFDYLKIIKDNNNLKLINSSLNSNNEFITKIIEISIIYDSIRLLNDNILFIIGNHELYLLANDKVNNYAINNCYRVKEIINKSLIGGDPIVITKPKRNRDDNIKEITLIKQQPINKPSKTFLDEIQDFILERGYIELINKIHIQHAPNTHNYLGNNKCNINTKLINVLENFKCLNIINILKNKVSEVDGYNKLCNDSIYEIDIYGHTPNEKILRCDSKYTHSNTKFFIDRQYSIYEIIKNIKIHYNELIKINTNTKQSKLKDYVINNITDQLIDKKYIDVMICGLIYYYCIQNKFILLVDKNNKTIANKSIRNCINMYDQLLNRNCNIYYQVIDKLTTYNMYIAQIFSLCYRFNNMYDINIQEQTTYEIKNYQLFESINLTCLSCDINENKIEQIIF